jgi:hypothetical protein
MSVHPAPTDIEQVVLALPRALVRRAEGLARRTRRSTEAVLAEWLDLAAADLPVEALDDSDLVALCDVQLEADAQAELSALLADNRERRLDAAGRARLDERMDRYDRLLLRKAQALREAVARGLRAPLAA